MLRKYDDEIHMEQFNHYACGALPPFRFILNCSSRTSRKRLEKEFMVDRRDSFPARQVIEGHNVFVAQAAKYVMLGCKPYMVSAILGEKGMKEALHGKLVLSICGGVTNEDLENALYGNYDPKDNERCRFVRFMPNTVARINQSMTVITTPSDKPLDQEQMDVVEFLAECIGQVVKMTPDKMNAATALAGSGPAFCMLMLEGMAMGIPRKDATLMAAQTMKGAAIGVMGGEYPTSESDPDTYSGTHPALLRDEITTSGGCTMGGLMVLKEEGVRGSIANCIRRTTVSASQLGNGAKNVNGV